MTDKDKNTNPIGKIIPANIVPEMEKSYLDYAMSVIVSRALPDVRDGLKPVHRRIIYAMEKMGLGRGKNVKSAAVVGEVLKSYHPHGDMSVYMAMVRMAQEFSLRYPLVKGQGNFGSIDGDPPAAMRYTEARMASINKEMIADINKDTVDMVDNYDGSTQEPSVLPAKIPNLLLNGADGIAVGMATKIPPHNLTELSKAIDLMLKKSKLELVETKSDQFKLKPLKAKQKSTLDIVLEPVYKLENSHFNLETKVSVEELIEIVQGPDFPTAGEIYGRDGIQEMYRTGRGKFIIRGKVEVKDMSSGKHKIIVSQLPYQVNKSDLVSKIADLVRDKKILGISDLRDESDRHGIQIVIELKKFARPKAVLNKLFKYTNLQVSYSANLLALVDGIPQTLNLRQLLLLFLRHRENVIRRKTIYDLKAITLRAHILEGLKIALDQLDAVIKTIRASSTEADAKSNLISKFKFTDLQADAILEMQLRRLAALERQKIEDEYEQNKKTIDNLTILLTDQKTMIKALSSENKDIAKTYGDSRKTKIYVKEIGKFNEEDLIPNVPVLVTITKTGYIKRVNKQKYRTQKRGGVGAIGMTTKEKDEVDDIFSVNTHDELLFFTNQGKVFKTKVWEIAESTRRSKGQAIINLISLSKSEKVQAVLPFDKDNHAKYILLATKNGTVKKTSIRQFKNIRQSGLIAIKLSSNDELVWARLTSGSDHVLLVSHHGKCIRFPESDARPMGRHTKGVRGIRLKEEDYLVATGVIPEKIDKKDFRQLLTVTQNGIGKRTNAYLYPLQKRGGVGVKASNITKKTGPIASAQIIRPKHRQVILCSRHGVTIRMPIKNIPTLGRNTKGVILMRLKKDDSVTALTVIEKLETNDQKTNNK